MSKRSDLLEGSIQVKQHEEDKEEDTVKLDTKQQALLYGSSNYQTLIFKSLEEGTRVVV